MDYLKQLIDGMTIAPFLKLLRLLSLPPDDLVASLSLLAGMIIVCELVRIGLGTEHTRSVIVHVLICSLTFLFQAGTLAFVLVYASVKHPGRGWLNLAFVLGLFVLWYIVGQTTKLVRRDSEGADLGFMSVGALITFPVGIVAALASG
jgi:hypothetical protein